MPFFFGAMPFSFRRCALFRCEKYRFCFVNNITNTYLPILKYVGRQLQTKNFLQLALALTINIKKIKIEEETEDIG
jgi:hypothetical protein